MFSTPAGLSNMSSQGGQYLVIHWEKITRSPCGNPRSSKTPSNTLSGLSPSILCILAPSRAFLTLPGCLKWTILPQKALLFLNFFVKFVFFLKFQFSDFIFDICIKSSLFFNQIHIVVNLIFLSTIDEISKTILFCSRKV